MGKTPSPEQSNFVSAFSLSITQALGEQLLVALENLERVPLVEENIEAVGRRGGIYQLFLDGESVYVGKSTKTLNSRIGIHQQKLSGRTVGLLDRMTFRALYVNEDLDALAPEKMLIRALKQRGNAPWNQNGFGNKDPGQNRDTSLVKVGHFDREYPINLGLDVTLQSKKPVKTLFDAMMALKTALPYNFRFPGPKSPVHKELKAIAVSHDDIMGASTAAADWLSWCATNLPANWMITAFPGYVIAYKENHPEKYGSRKQTWLPDGNGTFEFATHEPKFDTKGKIKSDDEPDEDEDETKP